MKNGWVLLLLSWLGLTASDARAGGLTDLLEKMYGVWVSPTSKFEGCENAAEICDDLRHTLAITRQHIVREESVDPYFYDVYEAIPKSCTEVGENLGVDKADAAWGCVFSGLRSSLRYWMQPWVTGRCSGSYDAKQSFKREGFYLAAQEICKSEKDFGLFWKCMGSELKTAAEPELRDSAHELSRIGQELSSLEKACAGEMKGRGDRDSYSKISERCRSDEYLLLSDTFRDFELLKSKPELLLVQNIQDFAPENLPDYFLLLNSCDIGKKHKKKFASPPNPAKCDDRRKDPFRKQKDLAHDVMTAEASAFNDMDADVDSADKKDDKLVVKQDDGKKGDGKDGSSTAKALSSLLEKNSKKPGLTAEQKSLLGDFKKNKKYLEQTAKYYDALKKKNPKLDVDKDYQLALDKALVAVEVGESDKPADKVEITDDLKADQKKNVEKTELQDSNLKKEDKENSGEKTTDNQKEDTKKQDSKDKIEDTSKKSNKEIPGSPEPEEVLALEKLYGEELEKLWKTDSKKDDPKALIKYSYEEQKHVLYTPPTKVEKEYAKFLFESVIKSLEKVDPKKAKDLKDLFADVLNRRGHLEKFLKDEVYPELSKNNIPISEDWEEFAKKGFDPLLVQTFQEMYHSILYVNEEIQGKLKNFKEKKSSNWNAVDAFLEAESSAEPKKHTHQEYRKRLRKWNKSKEEIEKIAKSEADFTSKVDQIMDLLHDQYLTTYLRDQARASLGIDGGGVNCEGQTKMILGALQAANLDKLGSDWQLAIQEYSDHDQAVLFNRKTRQVWNLLTGEVVKGLDAPLFAPESLLDKQLRGKDSDTKSPVSDNDLLVENINPDELKKELKKEDGKSPDYKTNSHLATNKNRPTKANKKGGEIPKTSITQKPNHHESTDSIKNAAEQELFSKMFNKESDEAIKGLEISSSESGGGTIGISSWKEDFQWYPDLEGWAKPSMKTKVVLSGSRKNSFSVFPSYNEEDKLAFATEQTDYNIVFYHNKKALLHFFKVAQKGQKAIDQHFKDQQNQETEEDLKYSKFNSLFFQNPGKISPEDAKKVSMDAANAVVETIDSIKKYCKVFNQSKIPGCNLTDEEQKSRAILSSYPRLKKALDDEKTQIEKTLTNIQKNPETYFKAISADSNKIYNSEFEKTIWHYQYAHFELFNTIDHLYNGFTYDDLVKIQKKLVLTAIDPKKISTDFTQVAKVQKDKKEEINNKELAEKHLEDFEENKDQLEVFGKKIIKPTPQSEEKVVLSEDQDLSGQPEAISTFSQQKLTQTEVKAHAKSDSQKVEDEKNQEKESKVVQEKQDFKKEKKGLGVLTSKVPVFVPPDLLINFLLNQPNTLGDLTPFEKQPEVAKRILQIIETEMNKNQSPYLERMMRFVLDHRLNKLFSSSTAESLGGFCSTKLGKYSLESTDSDKSIQIECFVNLSAIKIYLSLWRLILKNKDSEFVKKQQSSTSSNINYSFNHIPEVIRDLEELEKQASKKH